MRRISVIALFFALFFVLPLGAAAASLVNINTADSAALETLKGIGPAKAAAIIEYRNVHGPFLRTEDIEKVKGIGPSIYGEIAPFITVGESQAVPPTSLPAATVSAAQPSASLVRSIQTQVEPPVTSVVEPITSTSSTQEIHAEPVIAPAAAQPAAAGAMSAAPGFWSSPWTVAGLVTVALLAAAAFIFL